MYFFLSILCAVPVLFFFALTVVLISISKTPCYQP